MRDAIGLDREKLAALRSREDAVFAARTPRSRALLEQAREVMPNGVPMGWMAGLTRHPPLFVDRGEGARFTDVDGNVYLDMNQADLSTNCGFNPAPVVTAASDRLRRGGQFLLPTEDAIAVSRLLAERFGLPFWQYTLSASSANAEAIRLARLATGRETILLFKGHYHGHLEETLVEGDEAGAAPEFLGLPGGSGRSVRHVAFNDGGAAERLLASGEIACVVTEPALTNCGLVLPAEGFLGQLQAACRSAGTLLVLDETHTQVMAWGGLTRAWGLEPDMVTLGKSLGGGVAIGAYGMTPALARVMEEHLDVDVSETRGLAAGGTLYGNALSVAAARAALSEVLTPEAYEKTARLGARLADGIDAAIARRGLPWRAHRLGGRSGYCLAAELPRTAEEGWRSIDAGFIDARRVFMANRGIWEAIATAGPAASFAHQEADIDAYLAILEAFLDEVT